MKKRSLSLFLLLLLFAFCSVPVFAENRADVSLVADQMGEERSENENRPLLLLFLNPNGRPCQMQAGILEQNMGEIEKHVRVQGISTTVSSHRQYFYQFGVRQLPSLILIESTGKVIHRFSPGIHQVGEILSIISKPGKP